MRCFTVSNWISCTLSPHPIVFVRHKRIPRSSPDLYKEIVNLLRKFEKVVKLLSFLPDYTQFTSRKNIFDDVIYISETFLNFILIQFFINKLDLEKLFLKSCISINSYKAKTLWQINLMTCDWLTIINTLLCFRLPPHSAVG